MAHSAGIVTAGSHGLRWSARRRVLGGPKRRVLEGPSDVRWRA